MDKYMYKCFLNLSDFLENKIFIKKDDEKLKILKRGKFFFSKKCFSTVLKKRLF